MIGVAAVLRRLPGLDQATLELWIAQDWVRPARQEAEPLFQEIDVARLRLILDLRREMDVNDSAIPVVLSLLDQLYATRRHVRRLRAALDEAGPDETARSVVERLLR